MSHNTEPEKAARRHPAAIIAIAVALAIAALAAFLFLGAEPKETNDVSRIESETPATAEGTATPAPAQPTEAPAAPAQN
ncbi:hypothetical protein [Paracoccus sp. N5]|uniref:hypothetical protein n=1 Tax=Paracoccus sp. N5 TaxID=1101189 RepID=UPI00035DD795|nr:hypothetical protein [Paracoccus sp. N5]